MARVDISIRADLRLRPSPPSCADVSPTDASEPLLTPFSEFRDGLPPPPPPNFYHGIAERGYFYFSDFSQWSRVGRGGIFKLCVFELESQDFVDFVGGLGGPEMVQFVWNGILFRRVTSLCYRDCNDSVQ